MKGRDQRCRLQLFALEEFLDSRTHLAGGLIGEGDREDIMRRHFFISDQMRDPDGDHAGLARPGTGKDQQRALSGFDRLDLLRIEC